MIPYGQKLYQILVKMGIYKEKTLVWNMAILPKQL
jgi:hypothetical protein